MDIGTLIGNIGFPAAACMYMLYIQNTSFKEMKESINALNNSTIALKNYIEGDRKDENCDSCGA